ncbi:hypothetical protein GDO81_010052 [Engystomops pustulosus]|uniref:Uncharacterized protein n=1 Tax=Engystomops pustulosus TaxID=76066 RepID=A0AAV7BXG5_ENGPU|nr:hypothetical protein GDO81_010052 [Engystomops pustulosus]
MINRFKRTPNYQKQNADFLHMMWNCNVVLEFWEDIHIEVSRVSGLTVPKTPDVFVLGNMCEIAGTSHQVRWLGMAL